MRASTAAGINNSLLPRDRICEEFAGGHLLVVPSGERPLVSGICVNLPVVLYGKRPLFLVFVRFPVALSGKRLLFLVFVWNLP